MANLEDLQQRITKTAGIAYIRDTQITVWSIIQDCMDGLADDEIALKHNPKLSHDEILSREHSGLSLDDFDAAFFYYMENKLEVSKKEIEIDW